VGRNRNTRILMHTLRKHTKHTKRERRWSLFSIIGVSRASKIPLDMVRLHVYGVWGTTMWALILKTTN
jgi:hypothetical protein